MEKILIPKLQIHSCLLPYISCRHHNPWECSDILFCHISLMDTDSDETDTKEYAMPIKDGGSSYISIKYCPFCGYKLGIDDGYSNQDGD